MLPVMASAQPAGYYDNALGLNGQPLHQALYLIIRNHNAQPYPLWSHFPKTDKKPNGRVWDIYSDKPGQTPAYEYSFGADQCGSYNSEADCYNHEHAWPQGYFNGASTPASDLHHIFPTDGWVNNKRGNFPYGIVTSAGWTSANGSKLGANAAPGAPASQAFEPINEYKGDLARAYFYMATRYFSEDSGWDSWEMANKAELTAWAAALLLSWHQQDPVSTKEIARNDSIYKIQNNRNPFIDYPQFADCIWGTGNCASLSIPALAGGGWQLQVYPVPAHNRIQIRWQQPAPDEVLAIDVYNLQGQLIWHKDGLHHQREASVEAGSWPRGMYMLQLKGKSGSVYRKVVLQ
jgi:endonuclease I